MLKRDRTGEEKLADAKVKAGLMRLGPNPSIVESINPFPYVLAWDRLGRKGQRCKIIRTTPRMAHIEFEDGAVTVINRMAVRRL
jgi:hypothetical protein